MGKYEDNRLEIITDMEDDYGYIYCESCGMSSSYKFHCHHVMSRGRFPNHPLLDEKVNLMILCNKCHSHCHEKAHVMPYFRQMLIDRRDLETIFKNIEDE